uniref:Uncharacterized protein n=1 Tax=Glossina austeni TaxID=7395 RepID=A0A1A9VYA7_GLOAU
MCKSVNSATSTNTSSLKPGNCKKFHPKFITVLTFTIKRYELITANVNIQFSTIFSINCLNHKEKVLSAVVLERKRINYVIVFVTSFCTSSKYRDKDSLEYLTRADLMLNVLS